jgi:hypothetical protein
MSLKTIAIAVLGVMSAAAVCAQTTLNPDISLVGEMRAYTHNDESRPDEKEEFNLESPAIELNINGYLNPYARADAVIAWEGEENASVEEAYATILRGLPLGINLRAGKYLLEFGRLNPVHAHAWSFIDRPLPHVAFFGEEGLNDMTVRISVSPRTGSANTEIMAGVMKGDALLGERDEEDEMLRVDPGIFGRIASSIPVSDYAELAIGGSVINSVYEMHDDDSDGVAEQLRAWIGGVDMKYKNRPNRYTTLLIEAEGLVRNREGEPGRKRMTSYGGYGYIDYRFRKQYNVGSIFEWVRTEELQDPGGSSPKLVSSDLWRAGGFVGFAPIEETTLLRLVGHWTEPETGDGIWEVTLQMLFSLGPHKAHNF